MSDTFACGVDPAREEELAAQGWTRRSTLGEPRLSEAVEQYRAMGFEVHLENFDPTAEGEGGCTTCFGSAAEQYKTIYTRPSGESEDEDLF